MDEIASLLLAHGASINPRDADGNTPLQTAIINSHALMVALFLRTDGVDLNCRNSAGHTPLWLALSLPDTPFAKTLVSRGCDINIISAGGNTMLHHALNIPNEKSAMFLVEYGANPSLANDNGETPLHIAAQSGLPSASLLLLEHGAPINALDNKQQTPLMRALLWKHKNIISLLLSRNGIDVNLQDMNGNCALGLALEMGEMEFAKMLVERGADVNTRASGLALLHTAVLRANKAVVPFLLQHGANVEQRTGDGLTPLQLAVEQGAGDVAVVLCEFHASANVYDAEGFPPLWHALCSEQDKTVDALIRCGAVVNASDPTHPGENLLHLAVRIHSEYAVKKLGTSGADVNVPSHDRKETPLHLACQSNNLAIVSMLLQCGADVNAKDVEGKTPLQRLVMR